MMDKVSICRNCFHSYVCEQFNENKDDNNKKCHFANDHYIPRADVVPKSEVERLTVELDAMRGAANSYKMHYENLAREIFEEIELFLNKAIDGWRKERKVAYNNRQIEMIDFRNDAFKYCLHEIAELKKKYTEEKT